MTTTNLDCGAIMRIWAVIQGQLSPDRVTVKELEAFDLLLGLIEMERQAEWQPMQGLH
jgi:hypothetical protein